MHMPNTLRQPVSLVKMNSETFQYETAARSQKILLKFMTNNDLLTANIIPIDKVLQ
jgi:hypothetical protein